MDSGELSIHGPVDTLALTGSTLEVDLRKIYLVAPQTVLNEGSPTNNGSERTFTNAMRNS